MASYAVITVTPDGGSAVTIQAARDGSFIAAVDADSGDTVTVTGTDGTSLALDVP